MTIAKKGLYVNAVCAAINMLAAVLIYYFASFHSSMSYVYGSIAAQIFSLSWFLITAPLMQGPYFLAAAIGGFFGRAVLMAVLLVVAYHVLHLSLVWTASSFLGIRFALIIAEVSLAVKK